MGKEDADELGAEDKAQNHRKRPRDQREKTKKRNCLDKTEQR